MKRIIFHIPCQLDSSMLSASQIRPNKMLEAFVKIGYSVDVIKGTSKERKKSIDAIKRNIENGIDYDFVYSESSTMPTLLTSHSHFPFHPFIDFSFFSFCKKFHIPIGLFYRDIYWCFDKNIHGWKNRIARLFYKYDLRKYNQYVNVLFVPSLLMLRYIPYKLIMKIRELPAGCVIQKQNTNRINTDNTLNILYIGGIGDDYDLKMFTKVISENPNVSFNLCVRENEWENVKDEYKSFINKNVKIILPPNQNLPELFSSATLFTLFIEPCEYRKFAVPYKLFESIGYSVPLIASKGTFCGDYVGNRGIGLVLEYDINQLRHGIEYLIKHPEKISIYKKRLYEVQAQNTWEHRALEVAISLKR